MTNIIKKSNKSQLYELSKNILPILVGKKQIYLYT